MYACVCVCLSSPLANKAAPKLLKVERFKVKWGKKGGGETFSLSHQLCCCRGMQGRWKMQRREGSPPAKQRDFIVAELLNQIPRYFQSPQKLKQCNKKIYKPSTSFFLILGANYARFQVFLGFVKYVSLFRQWRSQAGNNECVRQLSRK